MSSGSLFTGVWRYHALRIAQVFGATYICNDREGRKQWLYTCVTAIGTTTVLKGVYQTLI
jgi:hypothetical protein